MWYAMQIVSERKRARRGHGGNGSRLACVRCGIEFTVRYSTISMKGAWRLKGEFGRDGA